MEAIILRLSGGIEDPSRPTICPICADVEFGNYLNKDVRDATVRTLRKSHHEFLTRIMAYLTLPQTSARDKWIKRIVKNCPNGARELEHLLMTDWKFGHAGYLAAFLCSIISACLLRSKGLTTQRFGNGSLWPTSLGDLLPAGPQQSFKSMLHWLTKEDSASVTTAWIGVMGYVRRDFMAELGVQSTRAEFVSTLCQQLESAAEERLGQGDEEWDGPSDHRPAYRIQCVGMLIQLIATGPGSQADSLHALVRGFEQKFLDAILLAREVSSPGLEKEQLGVFAATIYEALGTPLRRMPSDIRDYTLMSLESQGDPYKRLFDQIFNIRNHVGCSLPGCPKHPQDMPGGKMQRCGSCKLVQYCSRDCQRRHWKMDVYPHKGVCAQLSKLQETVPLGDRIEAYIEFLDACEDTLSPNEADRLAGQIRPFTVPR